MSIKCPVCMAPIDPGDGKTVRCSTACGARFDVVFLRKVVSPPMPNDLAPVGQGTEVRPLDAEPIEGHCTWHPQKQADTLCQGCRAPMCDLCGFKQKDGLMYCPDCVLKQSQDSKLVLVAPEGAMCVNHPSVPATAVCEVCHTSICGTCCFHFQGNLDLCPKCAAAPPETEMSPKRRKRAIWSAVLGVLSMIILVIFFVISAEVSTNSEAEAAGMFFGTLLLITSLCGLGMGLGCKEKRLPTPMLVWAGIGMNGFVVGTLFLLILFGLFMS